jgi:HAE1 family hydrophobic/amphiphilic exporter-1
MSLIFLEFDYGTNLDTAANDIRDKIDLVRSYLPDDADTPLTVKLDPSMMPIMTLVVRGERSPEELRAYAEDIIQPRLEQIDGVASAYIMGGRERAINIDIPRDRLDAYSLTISQIAQMIGIQNIQSAGGSIKTGDKNYSITTSGKYTSIDDIKNTVISYAVSSSDGVNPPEVKNILLRDIADVYDGYKTQTTQAFLDGEPCVMLILQKQSGKNSVAATRNVRKRIKSIERDLPSDVSLIESSNTTDIIQQSILEVLKSVITGSLLAVLVLLVFLRSIKSTIIIGLSIPISMIITLALMYFKGMTINMISLGGLLLGVGMLVDNSIVVLENIFNYQEHDAKPKTAAILGTQEMAMAVTASTLTTICIFLPMIMFNKKMGMMGQFFNDLAFTIVFSLVCSLLVALVLVPVLSSKYLKIDLHRVQSGNTPGHSLNRLLGKFFEKLDSLYAAGVRKVLHHKAIVIISLVLLFCGAMATVPLIGMIFMPTTASQTVTVDFELPKGTKIDVTEAYVKQMEKIAGREIKGIKFSNVSIGGNSMFSSSADTNTGTLTLTLYPAKERQKGWDNDQSAKDKLRPYFNSFPGATVSFGTSMMNVGNSGISIVISSDNLDLIRSTSDKIVHLMKDKAADIVTEPKSDLEDGLPQIKIVLDRARMYELGLNVYSVGNEISAAINGTTASRYSDNGTDVDMIVRLPESDRAKITDLDQIFVTNAQGKRIPLMNFARTVQTTSPVSIMREDQSRVAHVTVQPVKGLSINKVQAQIEQIIKTNIPQDENLDISFSGDYEDMMEAIRNFAAIILMAVILVFAVMASQFESFLSPFIIIFTIPLSLIGVATIYAITGSKYNIVTVMGILMLVGIIVNNGIVLVDHTNLLRKRGYGLEEACVESARNRLRPILMSTLTTIVSLIPMAFFPGEGSEMMQPISLTVFGGLSFGTLMTLFLMPTIYYLFNHAAEKRQAKRADRRILLEEK